MPRDAPLLPDPTPLDPTQAQIRTGIGGWTYAPWRDNFYPAGLVQRRELVHASRRLATIEINGTGYRAQTPATYAKWREQTPPGFVFSLKAPRTLTAVRRLATAGNAIADFIGDLAALGDRLGPILWQFEPSRVFDADDFAAFLDRLPDALDGQRLRHVLEVRHASFMTDTFVALARRERRPIVFTDSPEYPSFADVTGDFVYLRLMCARANEASGYPPAELDAWADRAVRWRAGGEPDDLPRIRAAAPASAKPRDVFVYFINGAKARAPHAALALQARIDSAT
ncbi:MAG: DUF72 domain-containing protein [Xanthomonadales bacterium]|nr:DUF72 domain-containing protein [Xanthomonadales bacterium]